MKLSSFLIPGILITMAVAGTSCSKSGNGGKPKLSIKSINNPIARGESLDAILSFTNGGNLANGSLVVFRTRVNQRPPTASPGGDTISVKIPSYNNVDKGDLEFKQDYYTYLHYDDQDNDTLVFRFLLINAAGDSSDVVTSSKIVALNE